MNYSMMKVATLGCAFVSSLALIVQAHGTIRPDNRSGLRGVPATPATAPVRPDDRTGVRGVRAPYTIALGSERSAPGTDRAFDWTAAGAGAGIATTAVLLLALALTLRRSHRRAEASA
jgi:hypothetical protein